MSRISGTTHERRSNCPFLPRGSRWVVEDGQADSYFFRKNPAAPGRALSRDITCCETTTCVLERFRSWTRRLCRRNNHTTGAPGARLASPGPTDLEPSPIGRRSWSGSWSGRLPSRGEGDEPAMVPGSTKTAIGSSRGSKTRSRSPRNRDTTRRVPTPLVAFRIYSSAHGVPKNGSTRGRFGILRPSRGG